MNQLKVRPRRNSPSARQEQPATAEPPAPEPAPALTGVCSYCGGAQPLAVLYEPFAGALRCRDAASCRRRTQEALQLPQDESAVAQAISASAMRHFLQAQGASCTYGHASPVPIASHS